MKENAERRSSLHKKGHDHSQNLKPCLKICPEVYSAQANKHSDCSKSNWSSSELPQYKIKKKNRAIFTSPSKHQNRRNNRDRVNHKRKLTTIRSQPWTDRTHGASYSFSQANEEQKYNQSQQFLHKRDGVTKTKTNTTLGCTSQFDLLVKPTPIPRLFLIGGVITHHFWSQWESNRVIIFDSHLKTALTAQSSNTW